MPGPPSDSSRALTRYVQDTCRRSLPAERHAMGARGRWGQIGPPPRGGPLPTLTVNFTLMLPPDAIPPAGVFRSGPRCCPHPRRLSGPHRMQAGGDAAPPRRLWLRASSARGPLENRNRHVAMSTDPLLQASFARASPGRSDRRGPRLPGGVPGTGITLYLTVTSPLGGPRDACNSSPFLALDARSRGSGERGKWSPFWWALEPWVSPGLDGSQPSQPSSPPRSAADPPVRVLVDMLRCRFGDSSLNHYGTGPTDPVPRPRDSWTCRQGYSSTCLHRSVRPLPALFDPLSRCGPSRPAPVLGSAPGGTDAARAHRRGPAVDRDPEGAGVTWSEEWLLAGLNLDYRVGVLSG